jgi:hypothetical protein
MQQWSSTSLISQANRFLDSLELCGEEKKDRESLSKAIQNLSSLKTQMLFHGFNAPFLSLVAQSRGEFEGLTESDSQDLAKQLAAVRELASAKKLTLNRVRVALSACRMALESLDDGEADLALALPYKGDYLGSLISRADMLYPYYGMMEILERECGKRSQVVFTINYMKGGKATTAKITLSGKHNAEAYVKNVYGEDALITESKVLNVPELLVKKRSARICLAIAYSKIAYLMGISEAMRAVKDSEKLAKYESFMKSNGMNPGARLDLAEGCEGLKGKLVKIGLATLKGEGQIELDSDLSYSLALKRKVMRKSSVVRVQRMLALSILKHFILKSKRSREVSFKLPSFGPEKLPHVQDLLRELSEPPFSLPEPEKLISSKLSAEALQPRIDPKIFGSAFVYLTTDRNSAWCEEYLGVPFDSVKKGAASIAGLIEAREEKLSELGLSKRSGKAAKFTELVKKGAPESKGRKKPA